MYCPDFIAGRCRSCGLLDHSYEQSLSSKHETLCGLFPDANVLPFVPVTSAAGGRIRAKLAVQGSLEQLQIGFLDDQKHFVAVDQCPLHHPLINRFTEHLSGLIREARLTPYDRLTDRGELKFVVVTCSPTGLQLMVQFVLRSREAVDRIRSLWRRIDGYRSSGIAIAQFISVLSVNLQADRDFCRPVDQRRADWLQVDGQHGDALSDCNTG